MPDRAAPQRCAWWAGLPNQRHGVGVHRQLELP
jgi:hypothetical protein